MTLQPLPVTPPSGAHRRPRPGARRRRPRDGDRLRCRAGGARRTGPRPGRVPPPTDSARAARPGRRTPTRPGRTGAARAGAPGTAAGGPRACRPGRLVADAGSTAARQHRGRQLRPRDRHVAAPGPRAPAGLRDFSAGAAGRRDGDDPGAGGPRGEHGRLAGAAQGSGGAGGAGRRRAADGGAAERTGWPDAAEGRQPAPRPAPGERAAGGRRAVRSRTPRDLAAAAAGGCRRPGRPVPDRRHRPSAAGALPGATVPLLRPRCGKPRQAYP